MKEWFKYEYGFVNIDDENLYLTGSGNWSETHNLTEKDAKVQAKNNSRNLYFASFIGVIICAAVATVYMNMVSGKAGIGLTLLLTAGAMAAYKSMKTDLGDRYKIPRSKIRNIKIEGNSVEIIFLNKSIKADSYKLTEVDEKGKEILQRVFLTSSLG